MFKSGDKIRRISYPIPDANYNAEDIGMIVGNIYTFVKYNTDSNKHLIVEECDANDTFGSWRFELVKEYNIKLLLDKIDAI